MAKFIENFGVTLGWFAQSAYNVIGDGLKAGANLCGSGMAKFLEFDGWLLQKGADGIAWSASTALDLATGGLASRVLGSGEGKGHILSDFGSTLGDFAQSAYDVVGDGLKAGAKLCGSGMARFLEFDGWLLQKSADGIVWSASAVWDFATRRQDAGETALTAEITEPTGAKAQHASHDVIDDSAVLLVGGPDPIPSTDWHLG